MGGERRQEARHPLEVASLTIAPALDRICRLLVLLWLCACAEEAAGPREAPAPAPAPVDRDTWWNQATLKPSGRERILAPRELRALIAEGKRRGFDQDAAWWGRRSAWSFERILTVDPDDVAANAATGRATLQSIRGFGPLWTAMLETRTPSDGITELLDRYNGWVLDEKPIFLTREEFLIEKARLREAA